MAKGRKPERRKGVPQHQKKEIIAKRIIRKNSKTFGGSLSNTDTMKLGRNNSSNFLHHVYDHDYKEAFDDKEQGIKPSAVNNNDGSPRLSL